MCTQKRHPNEMGQHLNQKDLLFCSAQLGFAICASTLPFKPSLEVRFLSFEKSQILKKTFKGDHIARKHGIYAHCLKWEARHQGVICVCCPEQKNLALGMGFSNLNRDFQCSCRHCGISWAPRGPALSLPALGSFLTYPEEQKVAQHSSLKATEFGGRRKCLRGLLEKMPGALDSTGRRARAHDKGDVNEAYKECSL